MGKLYSTLMCHIIHLFKLTAPGTYSSDEFLFEEFNISKEDRRWASENLHSLWLIDLQHGEKVSVTMSGTERQMQQVIKEAWGFLRQCNPSCSCRCYFSQHWPKRCSLGYKQTRVVICTPCWNLEEGAAGVALSLLPGSQRVKTFFAKLSPCLWWPCPEHSCSSGCPGEISQAWSCAGWAEKCLKDLIQMGRCWQEAALLLPGLNFTLVSSHPHGSWPEQDLHPPDLLGSSHRVPLSLRVHTSVRQPPVWPVTVYTVTLK